MASLAQASKAFARCRLCGSLFDQGLLGVALLAPSVCYTCRAEAIARQRDARLRLLASFDPDLLGVF